VNRRTALYTLAGAAAGAARGAETKASAPSWNLQYFYDRKDEAFTVNDFRCTTVKHGIAVGWITEKKGKPKPMSILTNDGGAHWDLQPLPDIGMSVFFLNDSTGWLVGDKSFWRTDDGGVKWKKLKIPKDAAINRVYFKDENRGWAACDRKKVLGTTDGGQSWTEVEAAKEPNANPDYTAYSWIEFMNAQDGIIVGSAVPPRPGDNHPAWMDPEGASKRREWPSTTLTLETRDGGNTWKAQSAPAFGQTTRFRPTPEGGGLVLIRFANAFDWPSEVYQVRPKGSSTRVYREKNRMVTDCGWVAPNRALLAAIEPPGRLPQLPIPGKLHMIESGPGLDSWSEMKVDYRAFGTAAMLSILGPDVAWVATDTGQILRLVR
jgi:hypothetical protein